MPDQEHYSVTVYIAAPGTPLLNKDEHGATSGPGHMFYVTNDGHDHTKSFGFAPIEHGKFDAPGKIYNDDDKNYKDPHYSRTIEITKEQYDKLNNFGEHAKENGFDTKYKDARHNCVDFTWDALGAAGIKHQAPIAYRPNENIDAVKSIVAPVPNSPLNTEHTNPMPKQGRLQRLLSEDERPNAPSEVVSSLPGNIKPLTPETAAALPVDASRKDTTDHMLAALLSDDPHILQAGITAGLNTHASQQNIQEAHQAVAQANQVKQINQQQTQNQPALQQAQGPVMKMG